MNALVALIGVCILVALLVPTVMLMQSVVERKPALALFIAVSGIAGAIWLLSLYANLVKH